MKTKEVVLSCLAKALKMKVEDIPLTGSLEYELNIDSTEIIGVLVDIEKTLQIKLDDTSFEKLTDVNSLIKLVESKIS